MVLARNILKRFSKTYSYLKQRINLANTIVYSFIVIVALSTIATICYYLIDLGISNIVVAWTMINALSVVFISAMVGTRWKNLQVQKRSKGNGDRDFRISVAKTDIRRSIVRLGTSSIGLFIGIWISIIQVNPTAENMRVMSKLFPYLLLGMVILILINEIWDRWALHCMRRDHYSTFHKKDQQ